MRFVYDFVSLLSLFSNAPKAWSKVPAPILVVYQSERQINPDLSPGTYASNVALLSQEYTSMIADCPDSAFRITSFHLSVSYRMGKLSIRT